MKESSDVSTVSSSGQAETSSEDKVNTTISSFVTEICLKCCFLDWFPCLSECFLFGILKDDPPPLHLWLPEELLCLWWLDELDWVGGVGRVGGSLVPVAGNSVPLLLPGAPWDVVGVVSSSSGPANVTQDRAVGMDGKIAVQALINHSVSCWFMRPDCETENITFMTASSSTLKGLWDLWNPPCKTAYDIIWLIVGRVVRFVREVLMSRTRGDISVAMISGLTKEWLANCQYSSCKTRKIPTNPL